MGMKWNVEYMVELTITAPVTEVSSGYLSLSCCLSTGLLSAAVLAGSQLINAAFVLQS